MDRSVNKQRRFVRSRHVVLATGFYLLSGCAPWNAQTRQNARTDSVPPGDSAYIESRRNDDRNYGCSFIEFDGKGGFLSFAQFQSAQKRLRELKVKSDVLLLIYCHGWNNNSQSADVLRFTSFLRRLSDSKRIKDKGLRVEGVYLGWRGSQYRPVVSSSDLLADPQLAKDFGFKPLTDSHWQLPAALGLVLSPAKYFSYWSIKDRGEFHVSRVPIARAVFSLAFALKTPEDLQNGRYHRVFVIGHSFGALVLEQAIGQASVGLLSSEWNRRQNAARWPLDLIVFLNSAAPSLYAKQLSEFLQDDYRTTARPRIVSLTSTGDWATGFFHPVGNFGNRFATDLQRKYHPKGPSGPTVTAGEYYALTPGHNKYLINHAVEPAAGMIVPSDVADDDAILAKNLEPVKPGTSPDTFFARSVKDGRVYAWELKDQTMAEHGKSGIHASNYWIGTVPKDIIPDHGAIWTPSSMQMLAAIYRIAERLGQEPAPKVEMQKLQQD